MAWLPAQLAADSAGIDRIAAVVARPIRHRRDQAAVGSPYGQQLVEHLADRLRHLLVGALPMAPNAVSPSGGRADSKS